MFQVPSNRPGQAIVAVSAAWGANRLTAEASVVGLTTRRETLTNCQLPEESSHAWLTESAGPLDRG